MDYELARLRQLRQQVSEMGRRLDAAIARREIAASEEDARRRRAAFRILGIPAALGFAAAGLEVARRWAARNGTAVAAFGGGAAVATAITLSVVQTDTSPPRPPTLAEPAPPLPPIGGTPPRVGPPKGNQRRPASPVPPTTRPRPTSPPPSPAVPPVPLPSAPPIPDPPTDPPVDPTIGTGPEDDEPDGHPCRLNVLGHGLICGHRR